MSTDESSSNKNYTLFKMSNGDTMISSIVGITKETKTTKKIYELQDPMIIILVPSTSSSGEATYQIVFRKLIQFSVDKTFKVPEEFIVSTGTPVTMIITEYVRAVRLSDKSQKQMDERKKRIENPPDDETIQRVLDYLQDEDANSADLEDTMAFEDPDDEHEHTDDEEGDFDEDEDCG